MPGQDKKDECSEDQGLSFLRPIKTRCFVGKFPIIIGLSEKGQLQDTDYDQFASHREVSEIFHL